MTTPTELEALAVRCETAERESNHLDVLVEIALFEPDDVYAAIRVNAAGTKVILTGHDGREATHWAGSWTVGSAARAKTAAALRARAQASLAREEKSDVQS